MKSVLFPRVPSLALLLGVVAPAVFGVSAAGCSKSTDDSANAGVSAIIFIKRQHTVVSDNGQVTVDVAGDTLTAASPFGPRVTSNSTLEPSSRDR